MATAALAQAPAGDAARDKDDIVVTGTLIRGVAPVGSETVTVSEQAIKESGGRTVNDVLATVPQFTNLFNRTVVAEPGRTRQILQPQIHGLDTLILIDGHRIGSAGPGASGTATSIDPSIIPTGVLTGIEVVADGGSALYGSDAVGGVVNLTTLKRFDGIQVDANVTLGKAYTAFMANGTVGKAWDTGSIYLSYAYNQTSAVFGFDRPFINRVPPNNGCYPGTVFARDASGRTLINTYSYNAVDAQGKPTAYTSGAASCNRYTQETIIPDEHMHSVFAGMSQDLGSNIHLDLRGFWSQRKSTSYNAVALSDEAGRGNTVGKANPFYKPTPDELANPTLSQGANISLARAVGDNLPQSVKLETWGITGELSADVFADFQVRLLGNYNESRFDSFAFANMDGALYRSALQRTDATALNPYDPGFSPGSVLVAQQIVNHPTTQFGLTKQTQVRLVTDGTLFQIPGGAVKIAVGGELIHEDYVSTQETRNYLGNLDGAAQALTGRRTVKSVFGELNIPLISPDSGGPIHALNLSAAGRYDHYTDFGGTFNPRFAATLQPVEWLTLRGSYGRSFLAPSLPQLFAAQTISFSNNAFVLPPGATSVLFLLGGNPNLRPQKATTWSLGMDLKVPFVEGLRASLTYYNVRYKDRLGQAGGGPIQFQGGDFYTAKYANFWLKDPSYDQIVAFIASSVSPIPISNTGGTVEGLYGSNRERIAASPTYIGSGQVGNIARQNDQGLDFDVSYKRPTSFGSIDFRIAGNYILTREVASDGAIFIDSLLTEPSFRGSFTAGAEVGNFRMTASLLHTSGRGLSSDANSSGQTYVNAYNTVNTFVSYTFDDHGILSDTVLSLQVNNLFDVRPPVNLIASTGYDPGDLLGRTFQLGVKKKF
ncbi:MAG: TonB-dependent receptor plug domain-containing protein [Novosphingobium sp.]